MIVLFEGFPGSGKSYDAVRKIISNLQKGRRVLTNIDGLEQEQQRVTIQHYCDLDDFQIDQLLVPLTHEQTFTFWEFVQPGDVIFIDEAQNYFNSRDWSKVDKKSGINLNREFGRWASEHRHNGNDLFLITPNQSRVESSVRDLVEWYYRYKKLNMFGSLVQKGYIRFAFYGQDVEPLGKKICKYDEKVFRCYKSFFQSDIKEHATMKHANILKHPLILAVPVMVVILVYFLSKSTFLSGDIFNSKKIAKTVQENPSISSASTASQLPPGQRLLGYVNGKPFYQTDKGVRLD